MKVLTIGCIFCVCDGSVEGEEGDVGGERSGVPSRVSGEDGRG